MKLVVGSVSRATEETHSDNGKVCIACRRAVDVLGLFRMRSLGQRYLSAYCFKFEINQS